MTAGAGAGAASGGVFSVVEEGGAGAGSSETEAGVDSLRPQEASKMQNNHPIHRGNAMPLICLSIIRNLSLREKATKVLRGLGIITGRYCQVKRITRHLLVATDVLQAGNGEVGVGLVAGVAERALEAGENGIDLGVELLLIVRDGIQGLGTCTDGLAQFPDTAGKIFHGGHREGEADPGGAGSGIFFEHFVKDVLGVIVLTVGQGRPAGGEVGAVIRTVGRGIL